MRFAKLIERYPLASYFIITFGISWLGALLFLSPKLLRGQPIPKIIPAGYLEEIGWTGFAMPALLSRRNTITTGIILGTLWGLWHLPVIDSFIAVLTGIRKIMAWLYTRTQSVFLIQFMHVISTGSLVVLGPFGVSPAQEALWYAVYAGMIWLLIIFVLLVSKFPGKF